MKRFKESNLRFRHKVMLGVAVAGVISLAAGVNAIVNVRRVEQSVNFSAEAASPLLIGVISLSESYQKLQSVFDPVIRNCTGMEGAARLLASSQSAQKVKLDSLKRMALEANALKELKRYEFSGQKIFRTRQALLDHCHSYTTTKSHFSSAENSVRVATNAVGLTSATNVIALESRIAWLMRKKSTPMPRGTLADYDMSVALDREIAALWRQVRDFYKIRVLVTELGGAATVVANTNKDFELDRKRRTYLMKLRAFERTVQNAKLHLDHGGGAPANTDIFAMVRSKARSFMR